jgi:MFS family permease
LSLGVVASLLGIWQHSVAALFTGALISGLGLGASLSGSLSALLPTAEAHQRAGLLATFYVLSYLALGLPALVAGASVPLIGLDIVACVRRGGHRARHHLADRVAAQHWQRG